MRIMFVVPSINLETGGTSKATLTLARELVAKGQQVEIFTTCWPNLQMQTCCSIEQDGVPIRIFPATTLPGLGHVPYSRSLLRAVRNELDHFDFFLAASLWNPLISHTMMLFRRYQVRYAVSPHGMLDPLVFARHRFLKSCWAAFWERRNVEEADLLIFNSQREEDKARTKGWHLRRSVVIPHSIDLSAGDVMPSANLLDLEYPALKGRKVVAFVGRINWVKNLDRLIAAIALIRKTGVDVALVCAGPDSDGYQKQLERIAEDLGIGSSVIFTGMLHGEKLRSVFARADIVSLVSRKENFGLSAAEALAAGVPVVLSDGVDMGEDWPTPPVWRVKQDERSIANGILAALEYAHGAGTPVEAARELAQREWGTSHSDRLIGSFESVLAGEC